MHYHTEYPEEVLQTAEPPVGDHLKCKDLVDAYEKWSLKQESNHRWCLLRRGPNTSTFWKRIQLFPERLLQKMCMWQSQKVIWDMINTLFPTLQLSNLFLLLSFSTRKHKSMASHAILSNFFEEQWNQNCPQYLSGLSRALFLTTFLEIAVYKIMQLQYV